MFWQFYKNPKKGEAYNVGGGRYSNCSMVEAIEACELITGNRMNVGYEETNRIGDHIWWISDVSKFKNDFPEWTWKYTISDILEQIYAALTSRIPVK
jgi:CDP-paratose 2-epimerase